MIPGTPANLLTKDLVLIGGQVSADGKSVDARNIMVVPALPPVHGKPGQRPRFIAGTIATLTPTFTVTAQDGSVVTVNTTPKTGVEAVSTGAATDITVGTFVQARVAQTADTALVASEVRRLARAPARRRPEQPKPEALTHTRSEGSGGMARAMPPFFTPSRSPPVLGFRRGRSWRRRPS